MKVVIVAKTRMGSGACIGAISADGRSVRLIAADQESNERFNMEYEVGQVWEVSYCEPTELVPPHVENIVVHSKRNVRSLVQVSPVIQRLMHPASGGLEVLFEGLTRATKAGALYVCQRTGIPAFSTMFWQPDQALIRDTTGKRIHYCYPTSDGFRSLTFVGFQEPLSEIPAGSILRVSLAHWWRPKEMPDAELRCYVQLSGWFPRDLRGPRGSQRDTSSANVGSSPGRARDVQTILKQVYGYDTFRPLQRQIIDRVLAKQDALVVMPTGSGKSLCFQLPSLLFEGLTLVVSPLISLMEDQVAQLRDLGVSAAYLNSSLTFRQQLDVIDQVKAGQVKLLYAAPETILRPETLLMLEQVPVDCLTIDESHCISEWGHDFRPEYRELTEVRRRLPAAVCLAVTATATEQVRRDIKQNLDIPQAAEFVASFDRENLFLSVESKYDLRAQTLAFLEAHQGESGII
jgi:ATP-dependent DNA helicase RecQ